MKKVYAVLEVHGGGRTEPLRANPTRHVFQIETFNGRDAAVERARALVRENPTRTYHVVESVMALYSDTPIKTHSFEE